jgi:CheY-like chemotaxis protein
VTPTNGGRPTRVLIVNDDRRLAESARMLLIDEGYDTRVEGDGLAAVDALREFAADVIILDLLMPRLDGHGFLNWLSREPGPAPIVVVWSVASRADLDRARTLGAAECLPGSTTGPDDLIQAVARAAAHSRLRVG